MAVVRLRKQLFNRVIGNAVQYLSETMTNDKDGSDVSLCKKYTKWPPLLLSICKEMALDADDVKRQHVCELYSYGYDKLAEEVRKMSSYYIGH